MKKVLLLPGWMTGLDFFGKSTELVLRFGKLQTGDLDADYLIGLSLGALAAQNYLKQFSGKVILINPPAPKRSLAAWFARWLNYLATEGLFLKRQHFTCNPIKYFFQLFQCIQLLKTDYQKILIDFPSDRLTVIRGRMDKYFCDEKAAKFYGNFGFKIVEVSGGHNWSEAVEQELARLIV